MGGQLGGDTGRGLRNDNPDDAADISVQTHATTVVTAKGKYSAAVAVTTTTST